MFTKGFCDFFPRHDSNLLKKLPKMIGAAGCAVKGKVGAEGPDRTLIKP
jgi:hypothetical protein